MFASIGLSLDHWTYIILRLSLWAIFSALANWYSIVNLVLYNYFYIETSTEPKCITVNVHNDTVVCSYKVRSGKRGENFYVVTGKWEVRSKKWEVGSEKWEVGSGKWEVRSGKALYGFRRFKIKAFFKVVQSHVLSTTNFWLVFQQLWLDLSQMGYTC